MPDSDWSHVADDKHRNYEDAHGRGEPPGPDFAEQEHTEQRDTNGTIDSTTIVTIWEQVTAAPPGQPVSEFCSRCPDHVHTVSGPVTDADQEHVLYLRYGDHRGMRYQNARIRGTELKREEFVIKIKPQPPAPGPGMGLGLPFQPNREHRFVFWSTRTIDRVVNGVLWRRFDTRACTEGGGYYVSLEQAGDRLMSAISLSMTGDAPVPTIVGNEFLGLLKSAARLKSPSFSVSADAGGLIVTLEDAGKPGHAVRRVRTKTEKGMLRYVEEV